MWKRKKERKKEGKKGTKKDRKLEINGQRKKERKKERKKVRNKRTSDKDFDWIVLKKRWEERCLFWRAIVGVMRVSIKHIKEMKISSLKNE